jgi:small-conductance mechanosensitive channel
MPMLGLAVYSLWAASAAAWNTSTDGTVLGAIVQTAAILLAATAAHWGLTRLARRLPRLLARRAGAPPRFARAIAVGVVPLKLALWLAVTWYVSEQFSLLRGARDIQIWAAATALTAPLFTLNDRTYVAFDLLELPLALGALWLAVRVTIHLFKTHVLRPAGVESGAQEAVSMLTRYALLFLGVIIVLQAWGINVSSLTIVASVLGVGIGFGVQNIANNFVSGLVMTIERPIQPGDFVDIGELSGTVKRIGARSTQVQTLDQVTILIPNSRLLETEVVNWSHGDPLSRLRVPVGVAYGSDIARVRTALLEAARGHPGVLMEPRPRVEFRRFGDSALEFELLVWTREPRNQFRLKSDLNYRIDANFRRHKVHVPFPQRDLHLRSPQIEQLVHAWSRRHFSEAELAVASAPSGNGADEVAAASWMFEDDDAPRRWAEDEIHAVATRMRGPDGVPISDRRHLFKVYPQCFVGREAVDWMVRSIGLTRPEALALGQLLVERGIVRHVLDEHSFKDGNFFYRFA